MPRPEPAPRKKTAAPRPADSVPSAGKKPPAEPSSKAGSASKGSVGGRTPTNRKLHDSIERSYMMIGTFMRPFGRWYPPLTGIGDGFKTFSEEAADAWMDLAEENPEVKKKLEQWTSASLYGNIIGVHFAIATTQPEDQPRDPQGRYTSPLDPFAFARSMGLSDEDISDAMSMAGMGDTIRSERPPEPDLGVVVSEEEALQEKMNAMKAKRAGIVTPEELGVTRDGQEHSVSLPVDGLGN